MRQTLSLALIGIIGAGCEQKARCSLGEAELVTETTEAGFDDVALATRGASAYAAWSTPRGSFVKQLAPRRRPERRLGERCRGGVAALATEEALWIACSEASTTALEGALRLYELDPKTAPRGAPREVASVGRDAGGVSLASDGAALFIAYGAGHVRGPRTMLVRVEARGRGPALEPQPLSRPDANGRSPTLLFDQGSLWSAWTESDLTPGMPTHRLMMKRDQGPARRLLEVQSEDPAPALSRDQRGVVLAFRTERGGGSRAELFVGRVGPDLRFAEAPRSLGRANGRHGPRLALCDKTRAAAAPLDHASELYVAFHPLSSELRVFEQNHQYYESGRELVQADAACVAGEPLVLMAEQTEPVRPRARLLAARFACTP